MFDYKPKTREQELNDDIKEFESFIKRCEAGLILASESDTAMAVKIALGGDNFFELWIDKNEHVKNVIQLEKEHAESNLSEARKELSTLLSVGGN
ncbi:MAG: hypothetical protein WAZ98_03815 [Cyclobacteriaceae bacterium]